MPSLLQRTVAATKAFSAVFSGRGSGSWGRFNKLQDPWPRGWATTNGTYPLPEDSDWLKHLGPIGQQPAVAACLGWIVRNFPDAPLTVRRPTPDGDKETVAGHALLSLLRRPNPFYAANTLWQGTLSDYLIEGNAYWGRERSRGGETTALWYLPCSMVEPRWPDGAETTSQFISHYVYKVGDWEMRLERGDLVHFRYGFDPGNQRKGYAPIRTAEREIATLQSGSVFTRAILDNMGVAGGILTSEEEDNSAFTEAVAERLKLLFRALFTGNRAGGLFVPTFKAKYTPLGQSPEDMKLDAILNRPEDLVCALFGLSPMLVGLSSGSAHSTYANVREARQAGWEDNLKPLKRDLGGDLELQLSDLLSPGEEIGWDYSSVSALQEDASALWTRLIEAKKERILTVNECRSKMGFKDLTPEQEKELEPPAPPGMGPESRGDRQALRENGGGNGRVPALVGKHVDSEWLREWRLRRQEDGDA